jgi:hypothetical protein
MRRSFWPPSGCTLKKGPPIQRPSSTRGNRRARKSAAHNLNDTIAVGALIQIKTPQMALFRVTEVTANVVTFKLWLVSGVADHADRFIRKKM